MDAHGGSSGGRQARGADGADSVAPGAHSTGEVGGIVVELNATESEARRTYTLKLWAGEAGAGGVTLEGVTFP